MFLWIGVSFLLGCCFRLGLWLFVVGLLGIRLYRCRLFLLCRFVLVVVLVFRLFVLVVCICVGLLVGFRVVLVLWF